MTVAEAQICFICRTFPFHNTYLTNVSLWVSWEEKERIAPIVCNVFIEIYNIKELYNMDLKTESYIHAWNRVKVSKHVRSERNKKKSKNIPATMLYLFIFTFLPVVQEAAVLAFASHGFPANGCPFLVFINEKTRIISPRKCKRAHSKLTSPGRMHFASSLTPADAWWCRQTFEVRQWLHSS